MFIKTIIIIAMIGILIALASGLFFLMRDEGKTKRSVKSLTWRIGISLGLFIFLFIAFSLKWIAPHSL